MAPVVRPATIDEAFAIAVVHVRSWQAAYPGLVPQDYLDNLRAEDRAEAWERAVGPERWPAVLVADDGGRLAGFVCIGPCRDDDLDSESVGEVQAIYLDPDDFGTGVGDALMAGALSELAGAGFTEASLWVLSTNERAKRFYRRLGWTPDGVDKVHDWIDFTAVDHRYRRPLGP